MHSIAVYIAAALAEIAGCFAFWGWLRLDRRGAIGAATCIFGSAIILSGSRPQIL